MIHDNVFTPNSVRRIVTPIQYLGNRDTRLRLQIFDSLYFRIRAQSGWSSYREGQARDDALSVIGTEYEDVVVAAFDLGVGDDGVRTRAERDDLVAQCIEIEINVASLAFHGIVTKPVTACVVVRVWTGRCTARLRERWRKWA
jgi:hypothetical protein